MLCGSYLEEYFIISLNYLFYTILKKISITKKHEILLHKKTGCKIRFYLYLLI